MNLDNHDMQLNDSKDNSFFIWGLGLLGTSLAKELSKCNAKVYGCTKLLEDVKYLHSIGFSNIVLSSDHKMIQYYLEFVSGVIIATPVDAVYDILTYLENHNKTSFKFVTDMSSTKYDLIKWVNQNIRDLPFIGSHPMAGSGLSGSKNAVDSLFKGVSVYITLSEFLSQRIGLPYIDAQNCLKQFWQELGGKPVLLNASIHDQWGAYLSHGVHLISCLLIHVLKDIPDIFELESSPSGGSLRDMTRIVNSDPILWDGILKSNKKEVIVYLDRCKELLSNWSDRFERGELNISAIFEEAAKLRYQINRNIQLP